MFNLEEVFRRLSTAGLKCKCDKCNFFQDKVEYLCHIIDKHVLTPSPGKIAAIEKMPEPKNIKELESFIGKINYYHKFINNLSRIVVLLNILRRKNHVFEWGKLQQTAFQNLKNSLSSATKLVHYNRDMPLLLATDASQYGIGAVISHKFPY